MQVKRINDHVSVAPQIGPDDLAEIKAAGFTTIINNRPDGEAPGQPDSAVMQAAASELRAVPGVGQKLCRAIVAARREVDLERELADCRDHDVAVIAESSPEYPQPLRTIYDPPGVVFVRGQILPSDALAVAIVGTRHATHYGLAQADRLAAGLSRAGYTIVSGLARGIDAAAHRGALKAGGRTLAVLGSGVLSIYPPEHEQIAAEVVAHGAVISENPPRSPPLAGAFPQRNRIVTGVSLAYGVVAVGVKGAILVMGGGLLGEAIIVYVFVRTLHRM